MAELVRIQ